MGDAATGTRGVIAEWYGDDQPELFLLRVKVESFMVLRRDLEERVQLI
jgi:hypothetical protein